jgi:tRNA 2-thiocytidine biosynthesis protein TtcA
VIRPLAYVAESDLEHWARLKDFPIIPCNLCGSQVNLQRAQIKQMLREWERRYPGRIDNMAAAMGRITPSHLMDRNLHPFTTLQANGTVNADGDKAFDDDACSATYTPGSRCAS